MLDIGLGHRQFLVGLIHLESGLVHLQFDLLAGLLQFEVGNAGGTLGGTHLIHHVAPVPKRHAHEHAHIPEAAELPLEAILQVGIAHGVATRQGHLRQIACLQDIRGLPGHIDGVLEHLQFRTVLDSGLHVEFRCQFHHGDVLRQFVGQRHLLVEGQSAELAEQHAREHQPVVHLRQRHLGLVHLHVDAQAVASRSHALVDHLVHVGIEFPNQFEVTLCELPLMMERHHLPVGLVDAIEGSLAACIHRVLRHILGDVGHLVHGDDASAHEDGLRQHDGAGEEMTGVRIESVHDLLSHGVERSLHASHALLHVRLQASHHLLHVSGRHTQFHEGSAHLRKGVLDALHLGLQARYQTRTQIGKSLLLGVAQQGDRLAGVLIGTYGAHMGQELRAGRLPEVLGHVLLQLGDAQLLVVAQRHLSATVEREHALRRCRER